MLFWVLFKESIFFAWHALLANKLRTTLSLLGITIGIFAIITVFTIVDALESNIRNSVASLGENVVFVQKWPWEFGSDYPWWKYMARPVARLSELPEVQRKSNLAEASAFVIEGVRTLKAGSNSIEGAQVICASEAYNRVRSFELAEGRYFTSSEFSVGAPKVMIGSSVAQSLFPTGNALNKFIKVGSAKLEVVGVFAREGSSVIGNSMDNVVLVPVNYAKAFIDLRSDRVNPTIYVKAKPGVSNEDLKGELTGIMRSVRRLKPSAEDNFALNETSMLSKGLNSLFDIIGLAGWVIGGFSILVGGFGIANIMFVSVRERTSQIGIQKALGARSSFILIQFMVESVLLSVAGGLIGLLLVFSILEAADAAFDLGVSIQGSNIILALTISVLIGIISGFVPSYTASQLDPVDAMRST
jgi:putative ABC transport system permease protein